MGSRGVASSRSASCARRGDTGALVVHSCQARLVARRGDSLIVTGLDAADGTPILGLRVTH